jgi:hypothetical protein
MRKVQLQRLQKQPYPLPDVEVKVVPAPTGGWNAIDPVSAMDPRFAPIMDNWVPRTGWVELRPGYQPWSNNPLGSPTPVETLMTYRPNTGTERLFSALGSTIYEVTTKGTPTIISRSGFSNARWQYDNFTPSGGSNYLYVVNGADAPMTFDGTTWALPAITGVTPSTLVHIAVWKRRIWFVQINSTSAWFLGTDAIQGAATQLDIGALITKGGYLNAIGTITLDGGNGPDDLIVLMTSRGEAVVYKGTDPTNANAFSLVGVFALPPPIGRRCFMDLGADLGMITLQGVIPLSQALPVDSDAVRSVALTRNIQNAMLVAAAQNQNNFGWQLQHYPGQGLVLLNVPNSTNVQQVQFVQNMLNGSWCRFTGWNANCFELFNDQLYFGDNVGNVNLAWSGSTDNAIAIAADLQCAFNYFSDPARLKRATMIKPLLVTSGNVVPTLGMDVDFGTGVITAPISSIQGSGAQYDVALYDSSIYSGGLFTQSSWQGTTGEGIALAVRMKVNLLPIGAGPSSVFGTMQFGTMMFGGAGPATQILQSNGFLVSMEMGGYV